MCNEEAKLWCELGEVSFALNELNLYLDTHCDELAAMELYHKYRLQREKIMETLIQRFGPVTPYQVTSPVKWTWVCDPWPWEGEV